MVWPETSSDAEPSWPGVTSRPVQEPSNAVTLGLSCAELPEAASQQLDWDVVEQPAADKSAMEREIKIVLFIPDSCAEKGGAVNYKWCAWQVEIGQIIQDNL